MPAKKSTAKKQPTTKSTAKRATRTKNRTRTPAAKRSTATRRATSRGSVIQIDSEKVGSPPREGEVLEIIEGSVRVRYRVRWPDGHESVISPPAGSVRITSR